MNPYEADVNKIPSDDLYSDLPLYGRYRPSSQDFQPLSKYCNSYSTESVAYWREVLQKCDSTCYVYPNPFGGRDVFALGSVIIKSGHLRADDAGIGSESSRDYSIADANEEAAIQLVPSIIATPQILFRGKIEGRDILVQSRIPGVGLNVAWPYLSPDVKSSFKHQARNVLRQLNSVRAPSSVRAATYIVADPDPLANRAIDPQERNVLFRKSGTERNPTDSLVFMHNDLQISNIIVQDDKIVGIVDWEHAGWFRFADVGIVHSQLREPKEEDFAEAQLTEEEVKDLVYWNDLYDFDL